MLIAWEYRAAPLQVTFRASSTVSKCSFLDEDKVYQFLYNIKSILNPSLYNRKIPTHNQLMVVQGVPVTGSVLEYLKTKSGKSFVDVFELEWLQIEEHPEEKTILR